MKLIYILPLLALFAANAQAASISEIFQQIADTTEPGNGNGHGVSALKGSFNLRKEKNKLDREVNKANPDNDDCVYDILSGVDEGISSFRKNWDEKKSADRLEGMNAKGLLQQIVYSEMDTRYGDSEGCSRSVIRVYAIDGSILDLQMDETD